MKVKLQSFSIESEKNAREMAVKIELAVGDDAASGTVKLDLTMPPAAAAVLGDVLRKTIEAWEAHDAGELLLLASRALAKPEWWRP